MRSRDRKIRIQYALLQCFYWAQAAASVSFASFYLRELGFSKSAMGIMLAVSNLLGFLLPNVLGGYIDRGVIGSFATTGLMLAVETVSVIPLIFSENSGAVSAVCFVTLISVIFAINPLYTKICIDLQRSDEKLQYSIPRALGSVSFAMSAWVLGLLLPATGQILLPISALVLIALQMIVLIGVGRTGKSSKAMSGLSIARGSTMPVFLRANRRLVLLLIGIMIIFAANNSINNYLYFIVENVGGNEKTLGLLSAMIGIIEVPVMFLYAKAAKGKTAKILTFSLCCFVPKILAIWAARSVGGLFAAFLLQGLSFALYVPAMVDYVNKAIPYEDSAKGQSLSGSLISLGTFISTVFSGIWLDKMPVRAVLMRLLIMAVIGLPLCLFGINRNVDTEGEAV